MELVRFEMGNLNGPILANIHIYAVVTVISLGTSKVILKSYILINHSFLISFSFSL
jgi:hypothetical protein